MIFSTDAAISFTIILIATLIFVLTLNSYAEKSIQNTNSFELEEKALMVADSMVKNYNPENTALGACIYDADKKRVKTNELSLEKLKNAKPVSFGKIFVKKISFEKNNLPEIELDKTKQTKECVSAKRFILLDGEKTVITIQTCAEE